MVDSCEVNSEHGMKALVTFVAVSKVTSSNLEPLEYYAVGS